jgi:hypothetical protein
MHPLCLPAFGAAHIDGVPHEDQPRAFLGGQTRNDCEILAIIPALNGIETLRGDPQLVADGNTDADLADVKCENASSKGGFHNGIDFIIRCAMLE